MSNQPSERSRRSSSENIWAAARSRLFCVIRELNLFADNPVWSSILNYAEQIRSTRLLFLLVLVSLAIIIAYESLTLHTRNVVLKDFTISDFERLQELYPTTLKAPCSEVSVPFNAFLDISPRFHQVCQSQFIRKKWISSLFLPNATAHNILDFRTSAFAQYRSLAALCALARQAVKDTHRSFNSTHLVDRYAFSRTQFDEIASVLIENLQRNTINNEKRTTRVVSTITAQNRLLSALRTNYYIHSVAGSRRYTTYNVVYLEPNGTQESTCDCRLSGNQCQYPAGAFYNWTLPELGKPAKNDPPPQFQIPGLMVGCLPMESIRLSTLECLYNQSCIDAISLRPDISRPKALNISFTRFPLNTTIGSLFDEFLFVESWENRSSFEKYFITCAPQAISYSYESRFHLGTIITLTIGAFGGLIVFWQAVTPLFIKIWKHIKRRKRRSPVPQQTQQTTIEAEILRIAPQPINQVVKQHINRTIHNFNLFLSDTKKDPEEERIGIIATRLYILLIAVGLLILGFYTSLLKRNQTYTVEEPSLSKFEELHTLYSSTLNCPCSRFSMSHARIISLTNRHHSICSSEFLNDYWLSYFGRVEIDIDSVSFLSTDFRVSGQSFFDLIRILCETSQETVQNALRVFRSTRLVSMNALSQSQFHIEIERRLKQFQQRTIASFVDLIELVRSLIHTNQIAEEMWTNVGPFSVYQNETSTWSLRFRPRNFYTNSCSCATSSQCTRPVGFYIQTDDSRSVPNKTVPGLVLGCFTTDSLLSSTLECFYDKECVQFLIDYYDFDVVGLVRPLDIRAVQIKPLTTGNSRFYPNSTINDIFSQLFVEDWTNSTNFTAYYTRCAPTQCTYTIRSRFDTAYVLAMMLGFYGGLSALLEIILPSLVQFVVRRWPKRKAQSTTNDESDSKIYTIMTFPDDSSKEAARRSNRLFARILSWNLFESDPPSVEKRYLQQELYATRIYILLFLFCMIAATVYSGPFNDETTPVVILNPTMNVVNNLNQKNISDLSCPCTTVAIPYSKFLSTHIEYHPICSSIYASPSYSADLLGKDDNVSLTLSIHYRMLSSLCQLSRRLIEDAERAFGAHELITLETLTNFSFSAQTQSLFSTFISQTSADYRRTLTFIVNSFSVNQLLNLLRNNWQVAFTGENETNIIRTFPRSFPSSNCNCAISRNCKETLTDDVAIGCFPSDGFRLSKLENVSLGALNERLFIERWTNESDYEQYFHNCQPRTCQYTLSDKNNILTILTTLLGLYAGLTYCLSLIIGQSLLAYRWWIENSARPMSTNA